MSTQQFTSLFGSRLSSAYNQLRGDLGAPQTATDTVAKLVDKIQTSAAVEDRRTAVLGLKGLSRDWKEDVGRRALPSLIAVLEHDAPFDSEIARATLETLMQLCETVEKPTKDDLGLFFTDAFLEIPKPLHTLVNLISASPSFYPRYFAVQFLIQLTTARPTVAQSYIMSSPPPGIDGILAVLDTNSSSTTPSMMGGGATEMLRNETLLLLPPMLAGNQDLQKIVAFSGAFEKLFQIIDQEGGTDGGIVVQDALAAVGCLLRFNVSNQNYFRELTLIPQIPRILGFPATLPADEPTPDEFALQYWSDQKIHNTGLVLGLIRMLVGGPGGGNQTAMVSSGVTRCLLELSLASNAPPSIKSQCLSTLTPILTASSANQDLLSSLLLSPLLAVQADNEHPGGGFVRVPAKPAVEALVATIIDGDPTTGGKGLKARAAGINMFDAYLSSNDEARITILSTLATPIADNPNAEPTSNAGSLILSGVLELPHSSITPSFDPYRPLFSCLLLSHLIRNSEHAKKLAREISFPSGDTDPNHDPDSAVEAEEDEIPLLQLVVGNLMLASREQTESVNRAARDGGVEAAREEEEWTRVMVGYLALLCTWLWDSPKSVKEFLSESNNLQALIQPITQNTSIDPLVQGLSAFLLGVCYEFNREPGEITRATLHPILHSRIGPDQFVSRMARLREDPRFRAVQPDDFELTSLLSSQPTMEDEDEENMEVWFDWAFVDFWKNHYYTIQRSIAIDPDVPRNAPPADDAETAAIIMSLRSKLKTQTDEVTNLTNKIESLQKEAKSEKGQLIEEVESLSSQVASLSTQLGESVKRAEELEGELNTLKQSYADFEKTAAAAQSTATELESVKEELKQVKEAHEKASSELSLAKMSAKGREGKFKDLENKVKTLEEELGEAVKAKKVAEAGPPAGIDVGDGANKAEEDLKRLEKENEEKKEELKKLEEEAKKQEEETKKKEEEAKKKDEEWNTKQKEWEAKIKAGEDRVKQLEENSMSSEEKAKSAQEKTATLESKIKELEEKLATAASAPTPVPAETTGGSNKQAKKRAAELDAKVKELEASLAEEKTKREEEAKEHEDLLVLLDELTGKRVRDKKLMKEKGLEVSEDEEGEDEE
ncbi:hypothetical protein I314_04848 [Cryptococcus bacillisporus CA1873]|uniref:Transporter n=1 Tax=Cryptococcus bacillisporus CA1873 TaxID=1296111 RepID=A0ABR5B6Y2_CRYGA|nr:hypothetical protein I314_04848 [Cryptococcus bacillisporus CA1873]|eukprot:KIR59331.1 hypothetical protein I314_04848 [Cryptococcus gattii CA1873]